LGCCYGNCASCVGLNSEVEVFILEEFHCVAAVIWNIHWQFSFIPIISSRGRVIVPNFISRNEEELFLKVFKLMMLKVWTLISCRNKNLQI